MLLDESIVMTFGKCRQKPKVEWALCSHLSTRCGNAAVFNAFKAKGLRTPVSTAFYGRVALWNAGIKPPREVGSTPTVSTIACDGGHK